MMDCSYNKRLVINTFVSKANFHCIGMALTIGCEMKKTFFTIENLK